MIREKMKDKSGTIEELYENYIKEKLQLEKKIEENAKEMDELNKQLSYHKDNYNELRMFSPRKNLKSKDEYISSTTEKLKEICSQQECFKEKLQELDRNIEAICIVKEKSNMQPGTEVLAVNENDRKRIARDLHDYTIQELIYLIHKIEIASKYIDSDPVQAKLELSTTVKSLKSTIHSLRNMVYDLHPMTFDDLGFSETLNNFIDSISNSTNMVIHLEKNAALEKYNDIVLINLFRIIQECCNNAIKHSKGKKIDIKIYEEKGKLVLIFEDDGVGFSINELDADSNHFGLKIIKDRVLLLAGVCDISSDCNGTKITVKI